MRSIAVWFLAAAAAAVLALAPAGCNRSAETLQRKYLHRAVPADLDPGVPWALEKDPRVLKARIWVDADFRAQNMRWKQRIEELIDEANQFLVPSLGVRIEVASIEEWPASSTGKSKDEVMAALQAQDQDRRDDVGFVFGFISALSTVSSSHHELGWAQLVGKYVVIRGYADVSERAVFARAFPDIEPAERESVHQARRHHKQTSVLIHEIGHSLGAVHEESEKLLMSAIYDAQASQLSDRAREVMQIVIDERLKPSVEQDRPALARRLADFIEANPWGTAVEADRTDLIAQLRALASSAPKTGPDIPVPASAYDQFVHARELAHAGRLDDALAALDELVEMYPGTAEIRNAICEVHILKSGPGSAEAVEACDRAAEVSPDDPRPLLARAREYLRAGDRAHAVEMLVRLEARAGDRATVWDQVAEVYQAASNVSQAEAAAARSAAIAPPVSGVHPVAEWAARTRARYGLPPDARKWKIAPDQEADYIATVRELLDLVYAGKHEDAVARAATAEKQWKGAPGILAARCDLELRLKHKAEAKRLCNQAVKAWDGAAWALYLQGVILLNEKQDKRGVASLRKAIAADPELGQAYRALGKALTRAKDTAAWEKLSEDYKARFGQGLPP